MYVPLADVRLQCWWQRTPGHTEDRVVCPTQCRSPGGFVASGGKIVGQTEVVGKVEGRHRSITSNTTVASVAGMRSSHQPTSNASIKGVAQPNTTIMIMEGGKTVGVVVASSTGAWSFTPVGLPDGAHTLTAVELIPGGGVATLSFTLDTKAPVVSIALAVDNGSSATDNINHNRSVGANVNRNVSANRNVNVNSNVNVNRNVDVNVHRDYYDGWDDHWHPVAAAAAVTATAMAVGAIVNSIPPSCQTVVVGGVSYSQCGNTWYRPQYAGTTVQYVVVNPPR